MSRAFALDVSLLGGAEHARGIHCTTIFARHALSPSTPRAYGATLRASGVDRSARPSKRGLSCRECRDTRLALFNRTYGALNKDNCPKEIAAKKTPRKTLDLREPHISPRLCRGILTGMKRNAPWLTAVLERGAPTPGIFPAATHSVMSPARALELRRKCQLKRSAFSRRRTRNGYCKALVPSQGGAKNKTLLPKSHSECPARDTRFQLHHPNDGQMHGVTNRRHSPLSSRRKPT
jgi:hypothetical protein